MLPGDGRDAKGRWPPEASALAVGIGQAEARQVAREFGQWAIVAGTAVGRPRLVWCLDAGNAPNVISQLPI